LKKSSSAVFLMEIIVIILFFTLSVTIISSLFVTAHTKGNESGLINDALSAAQSAAESFRARGYEAFGDGWVKSTQGYVWHGDGTFTLVAEIGEEKCPGGLLYNGTVTAYPDDLTEGEPIMSLSISRYKPDFDGGGQAK